MALTYAQPVVGRLAQRIAHNTPNALTGIQLGTIPAGATPTGVYCDVSWAFNNGATARIGFSEGGVEWALSLDLTTTGRKHAMTYVDIAALPLGSDRAVWVDIQDSGTAPTQGWAMFVVEYVL